MAVLVGKDRDASAAAMREHVITSMQQAIERLEPYFRARKAQGKTYSRKQFTIELPAVTGTNGDASQASPAEI
jgi:hypothetical protein